MDRNRLAVGGHSMGGGGALTAALQRSSLMTAIGMAPFLPSGDLSGVRIPTVLFGGRVDGTVTPSYLSGLYATIPPTIKRAYVEIANEGHGFPSGGGGGGSGAFARTMTIWMKVFIDRETRYTPFLCPTLSNMDNTSRYQRQMPARPDRRADIAAHDDATHDAAGRRPADRGWAVRALPGRQRRRDRQRHEDHPLVLQRRHQPAVEPAQLTDATVVRARPPAPHPHWWRTPSRQKG